MPPEGGAAIHAPPGPDLSAVAWTADDITRFLTRRNRLMRWGWPEVEAERMAERLVIRDRDGDDRVSCADCTHYRPGRCGNHRRAGLHGAEVGRDLAGLSQRCPGFAEVSNGAAVGPGRPAARLNGSDPYRREGPT